jgi:hypothetical protein
MVAILKNTEATSSTMPSHTNAHLLSDKNQPWHICNKLP